MIKGIITEKKIDCRECGVSIVAYDENIGLLPDEYSRDGERHATHTWLVCQLHQELTAVRGLMLKCGHRVGNLVHDIASKTSAKCGACNG